MKIRIFLMLLLLPWTQACSRPAASTKTALLLGGSGEAQAENFLIEDLRGVQRRLRARGWTVQTVAGMRDGILPGSRRATQANLSATVTRTLESAQPGERVLLIVHDHGREQESAWGQRSHSIVTEDRDASGNEPGFDLDSIEPGMIKAKARGVHIALADLSCYSGSTQTLRGPDCTVTLAAAHYVSLCSGRPEERLFNSRFLELPPPPQPVTLEAQFLGARNADHGSTNLPQISSLSTPAAVHWDEFLQKIDPLDTFEDLRELRPGYPRFQPEKILAEIRALLPPGSPLAAGLESRLRRVLQLRAELEAQMPALARDYSEARLTLQIPGRPNLALAPGNLAELLEKARPLTHAQHNLLEAIRPLRTRISSEFGGELQKFSSLRTRFDKLSEALESGAGELFDQERALYRQTAQPLPGAAGCREFQL